MMTTNETIVSKKTRALTSLCADNKIKVLGIQTTLVALVPMLMLSGCSGITPNHATKSLPVTAAAIQTQTPPTALTPTLQAVVGDYSSEGSKRHAQDSDWVGVMIRPDHQPVSGADRHKILNDTINIEIRARADIKQPTCNFNGRATLMGQDGTHGIIFQTVANNSVTFLQFKAGKLTIDAQDKTALTAFCSGGATLAGDYKKLSQPLKLG